MCSATAAVEMYKHDANTVHKQPQHISQRWGGIHGRFRPKRPNTFCVIKLTNEQTERLLLRLKSVLGKVDRMTIDYHSPSFLSSIRSSL